MDMDMTTLRELGRPVRPGGADLPCHGVIGRSLPALEPADRRNSRAIAPFRRGAGPRFQPRPGALGGHGSQAVAATASPHRSTCTGVPRVQALRGRAAHIAAGHAGAGLRAPTDRRQFAHRLAVDRHGLAAPGIGGRVVEHEAQQLLAQRLLATAQQRRAADEVAALVQLHREHQPGFARAFRRAPVRRPRRGVRLRCAARRSRSSRHRAGRRSSARLVQRQVDMARHFHRHVQLEARPADVAHARGAHPRMAQVDLARVRENFRPRATGRRG